ncbi:MAG: hypothetical protein E1N59_923 [Puniceicoccaceae bacterium 5H]|nr:MAG: hypothetical protein E1N59_923 [Puniceicoccaceae bacterium 5H]
MSPLLLRSPRSSFLLQHSAFSVLLLLLALAAGLQGAWIDATEEELADTQPQVDPNAGAEYLRQTIEIDDIDRLSASVHHYERLKIYTQAAAERLERRHFTKRYDEESVQMRVTTPDGIARTLRAEAASGDNGLPGEMQRAGAALYFETSSVEPGSVVEIEHVTRSRGGYAYDFIMALGAQFPIRELDFRFRPAPKLRLRWVVGNATYEENPMSFEGSYQELVFHNLAAVEEEPYRPPYYEVSPWIMLSYLEWNEDDDPSPERYWRGESRRLAGENKRWIEGGDHHVEETCEQLTAGVTDDWERLQRLYAYCQSDVLNLSPLDRPQSMETRKWAADPGKTIKEGQGLSIDINTLFASLAEAAGYEVQLVQVSDGRKLAYHPQVRAAFSFPRYLIGVKLDENWRFFDPADPYLPCGVINWWNTGVPALFPDRKDADIHLLQNTAEPLTTTTRVADFELQEDGDLVGLAQVALIGQTALEVRRKYPKMTQHRDRWLRQYLLPKDVQYKLEGEVEVINLTAVEKPLILKAQLTVHRFAPTAGSTLKLTPSYTHATEPSMFTAEERQTDVVFHYPWKEAEQITIKLPEGAEWVERSQPQSIVDHEKMTHKAALFYDEETNTLTYRRLLRCELGRMRQEGYASLKQLFDAIHTQDQHQVTIQL